MRKGQANLIIAPLLALKISSWNEKSRCGNRIINL